MDNKVFDIGLFKTGGRFWYSKKMWEELRDKKRFRTYAKLLDGRIVEYTEMVEFTTLTEEPGTRCEYGDAIYLGEGVFYRHRESL